MNNWSSPCGFAWRTARPGPLHDLMPDNIKCTGASIGDVLYDCQYITWKTMVLSKTVVEAAWG